MTRIEDRTAPPRNIARSAARALLLAASLVLAATSAAAQPAVDDTLPLGHYWWLPAHTTGTDDFLDLGAGWLDPVGNTGRLAEVEGLVDEWRGFGRLGLHGLSADGDLLLLRGAGTSDGDGAGRAGFLYHQPNQASWELDFARHLQYGDPARRDPHLLDAARDDLADPTLLRWHRLGFAYERQLGGGFAVIAGYDQQWRDGERSGRSGVATAAFNVFGRPSVRDFATTSGRGWIGAAFSGGRFSLESALSYRHDGGDRSHLFSRTGGDDRAITAADDRDVWRWRVAGSYDGGRQLLAFGSYDYQQLRSRPDEFRGATSGAGADAALTSREVDGDARRHVGQLGAVWWPSRAWRVRTFVRLEDLNSTAVGRYGNDTVNLAERATSGDRDRTRQTYSVAASWNAGPRTRLRGEVRYRLSDQEFDVFALDEFLGGNVLLRRQAGERDREELGGELNFRHRFSRRVSLMAKGSLRSDDISRVDDPAGLYAMGDHERSIARAEVKLRTRPGGRFWWDLGGQHISEDFERHDVETETSWRSVRGFTTLSYQVVDAITAFLDFSVGEDDYDIEGEVDAIFADAAVYNPIRYRTTTSRLAPGAVVTLTPGWNLDVQYERVDNRDSVANDTDRYLARLSGRVSERLNLVGEYRFVQFESEAQEGYETELVSLWATWLF
ncbi:MAG: hypothetical protein R6X25_03535 [Candidatus Krumholzibacteriia bacterium]